MTVNRKVIMDLIPLYAANELSQESRQLVEDFLKSDPDLAELVKKLAQNGLRGAPPPATSREEELRAFAEAKRAMLIRTSLWIFAGVLAALILVSFLSR